MCRQPQSPASVVTRNAKDGTLMVLVPAGEFLQGDQGVAVCLPSYYLGLHPVTNTQFAQFLAETGYDHPALEADQRGALAEHPVANVSCLDAEAYCAWAGLRLPTVLEWEKGARGTDGRVYPWGDEWDEGRHCQHLGAAGFGTRTIWEYPSGCSPWGIYGMSGGLDEWCAEYVDPATFRFSKHKVPLELAYRRLQALCRQFISSPTATDLEAAFRALVQAYESYCDAEGIAFAFVKGISATRLKAFGTFREVERQFRATLATNPLFASKELIGAASQCLEYAKWALPEDRTWTHRHVRGGDYSRMGPEAFACASRGTLCMYERSSTTGLRCAKDMEGA